MAAEVLTNRIFQFPDVYHPITITPRRLNFTSPVALTPIKSDITKGARIPLGLEVAFLIGNKSNEHTHDESTAAQSNINEDVTVASPTITDSSDTMPSTSPGSRSDSSGNSGGKKNTRTKYTPQQINTLEKVFTENRYPDSDELERLAADIGVSDGKIKIWFQNKRARWRRRVQNNNQQQHQTPAPFTGMYPILSPAYPTMPPSTYHSNPPYAYHVMPSFGYPAMPLSQMIDSNTQYAVNNMSRPVPERPQFKTMNNSPDSSPSLSPTSASTDSSIHSSERLSILHPSTSFGQLPGYTPINQTSQSSEQIEKTNTQPTTSSPSPIPVAHSLQQMSTSCQSMMTFYPHLQQYPSYNPYEYFNFPGYY